MQLPTPAIIALQKSADAVLLRCPETQPILAALDGKVVKIDILGLDVAVYLFFADGQLDLGAQFDGVTDTVISGTPGALLSLTGGNRALFKGDVEIEGDTLAAKGVKTLMSAIDLDVEEELSQVLGDGVAHQLARVHNGLMGWFSRTLSMNERNMGDYLKEEIRLSPSNPELQFFYQTVDELRLAADRLDAKIKQLEIRKSAENAS